MPTNRTRRKRTRVEITDMKMRELFYGPGTCFFAGEGYLTPEMPQLWRDVSEADKQAVLARMAGDWRASSHRVLEAWEARDEHELWCAGRHHGNPAEPWAQTEFGLP